MISLARLKPRRLDLNPRVYTAYGAAYFLTLGAWMAATAAFTPFRLVRDIGFYLTDPRQMAWLYLSGRLMGVFLLGLGAALVAATGARFWGRRAGLWAGLFFAAAPMNVMLAHILKPNLMGVTYLIGLFYFCGKLIEPGEEDRLSTWCWAGAMLGMAAAATNILWDGGVLLLPALGARRGRAASRDLPGFAAALGVALFLFFLTNPFYILDARNSWTMMFMSKQHSDLSFAQLWRLISGGFPKGLTLGLELWLAAALLKRSSWTDPVRFAAAAGAVFYIGCAFMMQDARLLVNLRHFYGIPFVCWLAGVAIADSWDGRWRALARPAAVLALAWALWASAVMDVNFHREAAGVSTKDLAGQWIDEHIPAGAEIGMIKLPQPGNSAYFQLNRYRLRFLDLETLAQGKLAPPEYLVFAALPKSHEDVLAPLLQSRYALVHQERPAFTSWFSPPARDLIANPPVLVFKKT